MIKKTILGMVALMLFALSAQAQMWKKVKGNGKVVTQKYEVPRYDKVKVYGSMDVELVPGKEGIITVTAEENILDYLNVESSNGVLKIGTKKNTNIKTTKPISVVVPFESLNAVTLTGSGDIVSQAPIKADRVEVKLQGSGDVQLELDASDVSANLTGSGDLVLSGNTQALKSFVSGSGDFEAKNLNADETKVTLTGSGSAKVVANESIDARITGSGNVDYYGNPAHDEVKTLGSGRARNK